MAYNTSEAAGDATAQIARLREQVETLMKDRVAPALADAAGRAESAFHTAADSVRGQAETVSGKVREQPLLAILIAAAIGYALGRVTRWSMRALRLARIAAEAEGLRLRYSAQRTVVRAILGLVALAFLLGALVFGQIAAWYWLRMSWDTPVAALILGGAELLLAGFFALLAARSSPGRIEVEALAVRRRALESATSSLAFSALVTQLVPLAVRMFRRR